MKRALILAAALTLAASAASAQENHDDHGGGHPPAAAHQGDRPAAPQGGAPGAVRGAPGGAPGQRPGVGQTAPGFQGARGGNFNPGEQRDQGFNRGGQRGGNFNPGDQRDQGLNRSDPRSGNFGPGDQRAQGFNRGYNGGYGGGPRNGYDGGYARGYGGQRGGGAFSYHGRTFQAFHAAPFRYPGGYGYRRWGVGERLPLLFLSPAYFLNWGAYNLGPPAPGCEWVRYGPDALMVNDYTGQVVDVAYGVFY